MEEAEIIQHNRRFDVFKQLQNDKTLVKMYVLGRQYERLTVVTDTRFKKKTPYFLIDHPKGFTKAVANDDNCRFHFEFVGNDNLVYTFRTTGKATIHSEICIRFPEVITRIQRRQNFRMTPPLGTKMYISRSLDRLDMNVIDISQGGALVMPVNLDMEDPNVSVFKVGSKLRNIELTFPSEEKVFRVHVDEAQVSRLGEHPVTNRTNFALQFTDIEKSQQKMLIDLIFTHQRNTLRKGLSKE